MIRRSLRRMRLRSAPVLLVGVLATALFTIGAGCQAPDVYVALGDSYTSGPLIPVQQANPTGCLRSTNNYPNKVQLSLRMPVFRDVSCSGAQTKDMLGSQSVQGGSNPPQFNALDANTKVVTVGIGGNDIGFTEIAEGCFSAVPVGHPCQDKWAPNGNDIITQRINDTAPKIAAVLQGIHQRSPAAKVFLVGYPDILPESGSGCFATLPITPEDLPFLRSKEKELNTMLSAQAQGNNAVYVDTYGPTIGHDACQLETDRWIEPVVPESPAAPIHPNQAGEQAMALIVRTTMHDFGVG